MNKKVKSLRAKFIFSLFTILLVIVFLTGIVQILLIKEQVNDNMSDQANMMAKSIEQGIKATDLASTAIEHQIDMKLLSYAVHIGDQLEGKTVEQITNKELTEMKERFGIAGITILKRVDDDIVGVKSTDPGEIGFSFKKIGFVSGYESLDRLYKGQDSHLPVSFQNKNAQILPIAQSGSHQDTASFFKYAYYLAPNTDYIINPYVEANEVYQFTQEVGPDTWIESVKAENPYVKEIAVLNPNVFKDPSLETDYFPPIKKLVHGSYTYQNDDDTITLTNMIDNPELTSFIEKHEGDNIYKMFLPVDDNRVIYMALDYDKISGPIYRHSMILIVSGIIALIALFLLAARFFSAVYQNIQKIKNQIKSLESGDFTSKSDVQDGSELGDLSYSANRMVETLHGVLQETSEQASNVQRLSIILENGANESVQKMYQVSMESTMKQREIVDDILEFLEQMEEQLKTAEPNDEVRNTLAKIEMMKEYATDRAASTTDMTLTLSDLLSSLHVQSKDLADISKSLLQRIFKFKL
jgi:methyl-accepting chemotaxis protein/uncharacterized FlaG/YvyC family protein